LRVALVDDDPTILSLLAELLRVHGHESRGVLIEHGDTIASSLDRIHEYLPDVILLDLGMPVPGLDILHAGRADARFASSRWILASASFSGDGPANSTPGAAKISKPYDLPELLAALSGKT
jgi:DNA-binding response OmpR family regulator